MDGHPALAGCWRLFSEAVPRDLNGGQSRARPGSVTIRPTLKGGLDREETSPGRLEKDFDLSERGVVTVMRTPCLITQRRTSCRMQLCPSQCRHLVIDLDIDRFAQRYSLVAILAYFARVTVPSSCNFGGSVMPGGSAVAGM